MTTNKSTHANCFHDNTKSARAACRRDRAKFQADMDAYDNEHLRPLRELEAAKASYERLCEGVHELTIAAAENNADDTSVERKFALYTKEWYAIAEGTLQMLLDTGYDPDQGM